MPDLDELMQEWPGSVEKQLKADGFPKPGPGTNLEEYIEEICGLFQIPVKNKIESLHLLFSLYASVKSSQLFKIQLDKNSSDVTINAASDSSVTDQLVLE